MTPKSLLRRLKRAMGAPTSAPVGQGLLDVRSLVPATRARNEAFIRGACVNAYLGDHGSLCRILARYSMFVDTTDLGFSSHMLLSGYWEMWVTEAIVARIRPGMHAVDVGANLGYFTLIMADLVGPTGRVDAFEPNPAIAEKLTKSVEVNGYLSRTTIHQAALGNVAGEVTLHIPPSEPKNAYLGAASILPDHLSVTIPSLRLDELDSADTIDLIKIDVEGAEEHVWSGMQGILDSGRPLTVLLEFAACRYADAGGFIDRIMSHGFSAELIDYSAGVVPTTREEILSRPGDVDQMLIFSR